MGVHKATALSNFPEQAKAQALLDRVVLHVRLIMARHKWRVLALEEFFPANPSLRLLCCSAHSHPWLHTYPGAQR
jgi:hypothetical protein